MAVKIRPILMFTLAVAVFSLFNPTTDSFGTCYPPEISTPTLIKVGDTWRLEYEVIGYSFCPTQSIVSLVGIEIYPFSISAYVVKDGVIKPKTFEVVPPPGSIYCIDGSESYYAVKTNIDERPPFTYRLEFTGSGPLVLNEGSAGQQTIGLKDFFRCYSSSFQVPGPDPQGQSGVTPARPTCLDNYGDKENPDDNVHYVFSRRVDSQGCIDPDAKFYVCEGNCPAEGDFGPDVPGESCFEADIVPPGTGNHVLASGLMAQRCEDEATNTTTFPDNPHYLYESYSGGYTYICCWDLTSGGCDNLSKCGR